MFLFCVSELAAGVELWAGGALLRSENYLKISTVITAGNLKTRIATKCLLGGWCIHCGYTGQRWFLFSG